MVESSKLTKFAVEPEGNAYIFRIEDDAGRSVAMTASRDQLDVIAETLDELLLADEAGDEVTDDPDDEDLDDDEDFDDEDLEGEDLGDDDPDGDDSKDDGFDDDDLDDDDLDDGDAGEPDDAEDAASDGRRRSST